MKKITSIILCICMCVFVGCSTNKDAQIIDPYNKNIKTPSQGIPLYFGYQNQPFLCAELREITETLESSIELIAINEIIKGPTNSNELVKLIPENTKASVSGVSDTLFVTLSSEFYENMQSDPKNWENDDAKKNVVLERRKMAIYSIVNTVTEIGNYSRVQILISDDKNPLGIKPKMQEVGFVNTSENKFLDTLARNPEAILTAQNCVSNALSLIQEKRWTDLYKCLNQSTLSDVSTISVYDFENMAEKAAIVLENFSINNNSTYNDSGIAIVNSNYTIRKDSTTNEYTNYPIRVSLINNVWKIEFDCIENIFNKGNL